MVLRIFLVSATALLLLAVLVDRPLSMISKKIASTLLPKNSKSSQQTSEKVTREFEPSITVSAQPAPQKNSVIMNDPALHKAWGLHKSNALDAWQLTTGSRDIVVAIVDTGIDLTHPDLKNNLWTNPGESGLDSKGKNKASNGIDDDNNGFIDDVHGWNFVHGNNHVVDKHGHGTHIAGIIGAEGGNNYGITGVAPKVSLMILKYFDPKSQSDNLTNTIKAFNYAVKMNAHVINYSGGGTSYSRPEFEAIKRAEQKGILFVAAAGNEQSNSDFNKYYPADYDLDNIISVTALDPSLRVLSSSNYGVKTVHIAAPGENIYSTWPGGGFQIQTGTSQATAFVSGVAALLMAHNRDFDAKAIKKYVLRTGDNLEWLKSKTKTSKKLNVYRALTMLDQGVGVSGVVAGNTSNSEANEFNSSNDENKKSNLKDFGQSLLKALEKEKDKK